MIDYPQTLMPGDHITKTWIDQLLRALRRQRPLAGPGIRTRVTPDGTVLTAEVVQPKATATAGLSPFACRFHVTEDDDDGKWEVRVTPGAMSVGGSCEPINLPMADVSGHGDDAEGWRLLCVDEDEGSPTATRTENEETVTVRKWDIVAHAKTSAKMDGVDDLNKPVRRLLYVEARRVRGPNEAAQTAEELARNNWGDEFSHVVGEIVLESRPDGSGGTRKTRRYVPHMTNAISVQGRARTNFDLLWYFSLDEDGALAVEKVYCIRQEAALAGITVAGDTMTDVTDATGTIYAKIKTNPLDTSQAGVVEVLKDPQDMSGGDDLTWLHLYDIAYNHVGGDYRATTLVNLQAYR